MNTKKTAKPRKEASSTQLNDTVRPIGKAPIKRIHVWQSWDGTKYESRHTYTVHTVGEFIDLYELLADIIGFFAITIGENDEIVYIDHYPTKELEQKMREFWYAND